VKSFTYAQNDAEGLAESCMGLLSDESRSLVEEGTAF
jgi:hypothetical protein